MTDLILPARSFEEAIPSLRRPYLASQVRAKVLTAPENPAQPCTIALFAIGETQMDRFTLVCGSEWDHEFTKLDENMTGSHSKPNWYCMVAATFVAFGKAHTDIGEGTAPSRAGAEMNARAQASKRAGRKFGPGQCLYACHTIVMFRGDANNQLRIPKGDDPKRYLRPYFDKDGHGQQHCRDQYQQWLTTAGEREYGEPLDHLAVAEAIQRRQGTRLAPGATESRPVDSAAVLAVPQAAEEHRTAPTEQDPAEAAPPEPEYGPMPDHPAPEAVLKAAAANGFSEHTATLLSNLARAEKDPTKFAASQLQAVTTWLSALSELEIEDDLIAKAIQFTAAKKMSQERRQAKFVKWLSEKAAGESNPTHAPTESEADAAENEPETAEPEKEAEVQANVDDGLLEAARAMSALREARNDHDYSDRAVTRLAALATGAGPKARVDWGAIEPSLVLTLAELLHHAGTLGWSNSQLDREILKCHNSTDQNSGAGRFTAFAENLSYMAETRAMTAAEAA
jgi:hypothetical protein